MKTFKQFQEAAIAAPAIVGASKYIIPLLMTGIGAAGTILQARKTGDIPTNYGDGSEVSGKSGVNRRYKTRKDRNPNKPKRKLSAAEKKIFDAQKKDIMQKGSEDFSTQGLIKRADKFTNQTTRGTTKNSDAGYTIEDVAPTNSMGGGAIAGSIEAGDEPPVNKRKKKGEPTIIARRCMPGARSRFKSGVQLLASLKKNK